MFISNAYAQVGGAATTMDALYSFLFQVIAILFIFYLFYFRPMLKKSKEHQKMVMALKKGDKVIIGDGILGKVVNANDDNLEVDIAPNTTVTVLRQSVKAQPEPAPANQNQKNKK